MFVFDIIQIQTRQTKSVDCYHLCINSSFYSGNHDVDEYYTQIKEWGILTVLSCPPCLYAHPLHKLNNEEF